MENKGSTSTAMELAAQGDKAAQDLLFAKYFQKLVRAALPRLGPLRHGLRDEEVAASSTMRDYFEKAQAGKLPGLVNRENLLAYLMVVVRSKAIGKVRKGNSLTSGGKVTGEITALLPGTDSDDTRAADWAVDREPLPDEIAEMRFYFEWAEKTLNDQNLFKVLVLSTEGKTNQEIGDDFGLSVPWVKRAKALAIKILQDNAWRLKT